VIQTSLVTANPLRYAARCVQHLVATRGTGVDLGGFKRASKVEAAL